MLTRSNSREFVQIRYKLKIRFINNFSWVHLLENQVHIMFSVGGLSCFRCSVIWRYLLVLLCFCAGGISGLWYSHYIKSPRQSLCVTSELTTNGWFSWFLLGGIVLVDSRWQCLVLLESSNNKPTDYSRALLQGAAWNRVHEIVTEGQVPGSWHLGPSQAFIEWFSHQFPSSLSMEMCNIPEWLRQTWVWSLAEPLTSCVILAKLLNLSEPQYPRCYKSRDQSWLCHWGSGMGGLCQGGWEASHKL